MNDDLLKMLYERDESALEKIQMSYGGMIKGLSYRILGSDQDAEECLNDVLLEIWNTIPPAKPEKISAYACMLARRTAIDKLRKNTAEKRSGGEYAVALEELEDCLTDGKTVEEGIDSEEISKAVNAFLERIRPIDRFIFVSRYYAFCDISEISQKTGLGKNAVNIRLSRMRNQLKKFFSERNICI